MRTHRQLAIVLALGVLLPGTAAAQGFHSVFSRDGADVWAVGDSGAVYRSFNGGLAWISGKLGGRALRGVSARGFNVLVAGDSGRIWRSANSGGAWSLTELPGSPDLLALDVPSDSIAYVAGTGGTLYRTSDAGVSWSALSTGTAEDLRALRFTDASSGWAVGRAGTVLSTTDSGATWSPVAVGTSNTLLAVDQRGAEVWVVGEGGTARRSTDGGANWAPVDLKLDSRSDVRAVCITAADSVWLAGGGGFIRRTTDGGASWWFAVHGMHAPITDLHFAAGGVWACSDRHRSVMSSVDGGATWHFPTGATLTKTWTPRLLPSSVSVRGRTFALNPKDANTIYAALGNIVYVSRDLGDSWTQIATIPLCNRTNAFVVSPKDSNLWIAAVAGSLPKRLVKSTDHGQNWTTTLTHEFGEFGIPIGMDPDHPDTLYFGGDNDQLYRSTDAGTSWLPFSSAKVFRSPCEVIVVPDSSALILVGDGITSDGQAEIHKSADRGATFTLQNTRPSGISEIPGMAVGRLRNSVAFATNWSNGVCMRSDDYGTTWGTASATTTTWGVDVSADDPNCVIFGSYGGVFTYLSDDGGMTFAPTTISGVNYALYARDRAVILAEQSGGLYKLYFQYNVTPASGAQSLTVTAPNGGEVWPGGATRTVTWNAANVAIARIEYRRDVNDPWQHVADVEGYLGRYDWTVPLDVTTTARIRVRDAWDSAPDDSSNAPFTIAVPAVDGSPASLDFGEREIGLTAVLPVTVENVGTGTLTVTSITTGTARFVPGRTGFTLAPGASDTVGVSFESPAPGMYEDTLRITSDSYDGKVLVVPLQALAVDTLSADVVSPDGGEEWEFNSVHDVVWTANVSMNVTIEYQTTPAGVWQTIAASVPAQSSPYPWTVPFDTTSQARVRVREEGGSRFDASAATFRITAPILIEEPNPMNMLLVQTGDVRSDSLRLRNGGSAALSIPSVTSDNPRFWPGRTTLTLAPFTNDTLGVWFAPESDGPDSALITIETNDPYGTRTIRVRGEATSNVAVGDDGAPAFALWQNEPNPFQTRTRIRYALPARARVRLEVFDLQGHRVATLARGEQGPGEYGYTFAPGRAGPGGERIGALSAGVYFVRLQAGAFASTRKMLLLR